MLSPEDAPGWIRDDSLRKKGAQINNERLRVWNPDDAPAWISARRKREEWAQKKNEKEKSELVYLVPCKCDKCGKEFVGIYHSRTICDEETGCLLGLRRDAVHNETDCVLCEFCHTALVAALKKFETTWVNNNSRQEI